MLAIHRHAVAAGIQVRGRQAVVGVHVTAAEVRGGPEDFDIFADSDILQAVHIDRLVGGAEQVAFLVAQDIGHGLEITGDAQIFQVGAVHRSIDCTDRGAPGSPGAGIIHGQVGLAVDVDQPDHIAGVDQVRVLDLGVALPDLRPLPGFVEEASGDIPERVTFHHHVFGGVAGLEHIGRRRLHDQQAGAHGQSDE